MNTISIITATHLRPGHLAERALPSVLAQTDNRFEWVIVNDGGDPETRAVIQSAQAKHPEVAISYHEIEHSASGFGLCHARNRGLDVAVGDFVTYLDDDNRLKPTFVAETLRFMAGRPELSMTMAQQERRRDIVLDGVVARRGSEFIAPATGASLGSLVRLKDIFDSNGFCHTRSTALRWNGAYRVFADYEFLLQCASIWGINAFALNEQILVEYVQSSEGTIGRSNFEDWASELRSIHADRARYAILAACESDTWLPQEIHSYQAAFDMGLRLPGFSSP